MRSRRGFVASNHAEGEFLWLMSLSDLLILLFILFVMLFSFMYKKIDRRDVQALAAAMRNEKTPTSPLEEVAANVAKLVSEKHLENEVQVAKTRDAVLVEIKDRVLFASGEYAINGDGLALVKQLARIVEKVPDPYRIGIEGHTDDVPMRSKSIVDNWDLGSKRAHAVMGALALSPALLRRTVLMSYGDMMPVAPNRGPNGQPIAENRSRNRRVTLRIF